MAMRQQMTLEAVTAMRAAGKKWVEIQRYFGVSYFVIRRLDHDWAAKTQRRVDEARRRFGGGARSLNPRNSELVKNKPSAIDVAARLAEIPVDTRELTGVLMGDPLPGRSALDRMTTAKGDHDGRSEF
jgi:hypothetical protein